MQACFVCLNVFAYLCLQSLSICSFNASICLLNPRGSFSVAVGRTVIGGTAISGISIEPLPIIFSVVI